ncbi:alpha-L-rhamnosidase [Candidatus Halobonum tyrrellensis]|uniref:alpha-L-rhamnosidase n=1 Tax=Candidatus Halobonum tyrrellensis G22 TaxID=1324957 RepID=V4HBE9_9EURY|nr:alpha-L-rhamnosidase [Candidatus Halobonum tyrrellensis]ESP87363.1 alpha-L-rhamnosidase [Candidatus Halobonum tyrrellensis G22]
MSDTSGISGSADTDRRPTDLRVEHESAPENVDPTAAPRFSWRLATDRRGAAQSAYRVVVGRDADAVADGRGDVWDSGRVDSREFAGVRYDGPPLAGDGTYHWSVAVWTDAGERTAWAEPARFATALRPTEWRGEWVAHQPGSGDANGWRGRWRADDWDGAERVTVDLGGRRPVSAVGLHPADPVTVVRTPDGAVVGQSWSDSAVAGFGFPDAYRVEVADDADFADATVVAEVGPTDPESGAFDSEGDETGDADGAEDPDPTRSRTHDADATGRYVRVTATELDRVAPGSSGWAGGDGRRTAETEPWRCFALAGVTVRTADGDGDAAAERPVTASSSVESEAWGRDYLTGGAPESELASTSPLLRTEFHLDGAVRSARAHVAAVGYGEVYVDGERVGERRLDPAWTDYERRVLTTTHDVTDRVSEGANAFGLWLGRGWFSKRSAHWVADGAPRARVTLVVELADGRTRTVTTDGDWRAAESPVVDNDIYDGERYDARRERDGWAEPGFDDADWDQAAVVDPPGGALEPERIEPMGVVETFEPEAVHDHPAGPILDFGQNLTGWLAVELGGADAGDEVTLRHAEALTDEGDLSTTDLRTADAADTYVARGGDEETYEPRFTYHGFRYAQVSGAPDGFDPETVTAKAVHTAMDRRGEFACSNPDLNRVQHNAVWGLRGNTHSVPEDCPQRDERFGWTGDAQLSNRALLYNFDALRFGEKWLADHDDAASPMGYVPDVVPDKGGTDPADPSWSVTRVTVPWNLYRHDGDEAVLREGYESMRAYVDYWHAVADEGLVPERYGKYGDWLAFENTDGRRGLPVELFATAFHYRATETFARVAAVVGNEADAATYRERAAGIKEAFNDRYFDADAGVYEPGTQASTAVPLFVGLVPDGEEAAVAETLAETVRADGRRLKTGFLGTRALLHALADHGYADLAYEVASQPERPGWVYMVKQGATTVWERWDSDDSVGSGMNSLNHSPFTHVSEFLYEALAGIRFDDRPATERVTVAPSLVDDLSWVSASVDTRAGELAVAWERTEGDDEGGERDGYDLAVTVPWNTRATVRLPGAADAAVTEAGDPVDERPGVRAVERADGELVVDVGAGDYEFAVEVETA